MAEGGVKYYMYNKLVPVKYQSGSVVIKCDDTGAITDNILMGQLLSSFDEA